MIGLILNSGMGTRMGESSKHHPKCMTELLDEETILDRQLHILKEVGLSHVVVTTGKFDEVIQGRCRVVEPGLHFTFVNNPVYADTNYIYSIYLAREKLRDEDVLLMHGDMVFTANTIQEMMVEKRSCMAVCREQDLPEKDFKAVLKYPREQVENNPIREVGVDCFENAWAAQPVYVLKRKDWSIWLKKIEEFCEQGNVKCYAENAFNEVSDQCLIYPFEVGRQICAEVDTPEDLERIRKQLEGEQKR